MPLNDTQSLTEQSRIVLDPRKPNGEPGVVDTRNGPFRVELVSGPGRIVADPSNPVLIYGDAEGDVSEFDVIVDADLGEGVREIRERVTGSIPVTEVSSLGLSAAKEARA